MTLDSIRTRLRHRCDLALAGLIIIGLVDGIVTPSVARAGSMEQPERARSVKGGDELYRAACAACHGAEGTGAPRHLIAFDTPLPDFTDCAFASREPDADWFAITHDGGPTRGFDRRMPAFGAALDEADIQRALDFIRGFCRDRAWPRGELNLPRPLVTEKAYPEDEAVLTTSITTGGAGAITNQFLYERRFGARSQFEIAVPVALQEGEGGTWDRGLGDVAVAVKHVLMHSLQRGTIASISGELVLPTGKEERGFGKGVTVFEPFVTVGQLFPQNAFLHLQAGAELPADRDKASNEVFWRAVVGRTWEQGRFGRAWSPMIEVLGARELLAGSRAQWDLLPQMQVTLSRRQHIMVSAGLRIPLNERAGRHPQAITYFLWDWFDGGLWEGWR